MDVPAFLRSPAVPFAAVAAVVAILWFYLGLPVDMPRAPLAAGAKLDCLSYAPRPPEASGETVQRKEIDADLALLASHAACVRTAAASGGLEQVPGVAARHGLAVLQGVRLGRDAAQNRAELQAAIALARKEKQAIRALVVGSGVISRGEMPAPELALTLRRVREQTGLPVAYADRWDTWLSARDLAGAVNFILIEVPLYRADPPLAARDAARHLVDARARVAAAFPNREILVEFGWPTAGPMREAALPSRANQARVLHEVLTAAAARNFSVNVFEAFDQPWRLRGEGSAGAHWGYLDRAAGAPKFRWGVAVIEHPLWFFQGLIGVLLAAVVFAAGYLGRRSLGGPALENPGWLRVGAVALGGALFIGLAIVQIQVEGTSLIDWAQSLFLILIAMAVPPVAAAALVRRTRFEGFAAALDPILRTASDPLARVVALLLVLTVAAAIQISLASVFDPGPRDYPFASFTGPAAAYVVLALFNPPGERRSSAAEPAAAVILAGAALLCVVNATVSNWQALWFAGCLAALAFAVWRTRGARTR